jgi:hypothetical protein
MFGAGNFTGVANVSFPTPTTFNTLQDWTFSFKRTVKSLVGQNQFPDDVCAGESTITGKVTMGSFSGRIITDLVAGASYVSQYQVIEALKELKIVKSDGTLIVNNHGANTFIRDLGVVDTATNLPLTRVATIAHGNHYTVDTTGNYAFHTSRAADQVAISYQWQSKSMVNGAQMNITNQLQGKIGDFTAVMASNWNGEQNVFTLNSCIVSDFEFGTKQGDYGKPTLSYQAQTDAYGNIGTISVAQLR